jgi:hypothetical protein
MPQTTIPHGYHFPDVLYLMRSHHAIFLVWDYGSATVRAVSSVHCRHVFA